jgi:hypothetical protein
MERPKTTWDKVKRPLLYIIIILTTTAFVEEIELKLTTKIILSLGFIIPELISDYKPEYVAYLNINRRVLLLLVFVVCFTVAVMAFLKFPFPPDFYFTHLDLDDVKHIVGMVLQGAMIGITARMLIMQSFYKMMRARDPYFSKVMILLVYIAFVVLLPIKHKYFISLYFVGIGLGFYIHFMARVSERRDASYSRLRQNLLSMIENLRAKPGYVLNTMEEEAINLYAREKWNKLEKLLNANAETEILFFIRVCMERKLHRYDAALNLIKEKLEHSDWLQKYEHYFFMLRALNKNEKVHQHEDKNTHESIIRDLLHAVRVNESCLLSNASLALKLANEIDPDSPKETDSAYKDLSLKHIWRAMTIYEEREKNPKVVSLLTGMTIPFTYAFLLDTYGYVLLKNGRLRFSKALFIQCIYQDPTFSPPYLHLAEWYMEYYKNHENEYWKKAAKLNLHIAINNEKVNNKGGSESFISYKAKKLLEKLKRN